MLKITNIFGLNQGYGLIKFKFHSDSYHSFIKQRHGIFIASTFPFWLVKLHRNLLKRNFVQIKGFIKFYIKMEMECYFHRSFFTWIIFLLNSGIQKMKKKFKLSKNVIFCDGKVKVESGVNFELRFIQNKANLFDVHCLLQIELIFHFCWTFSCIFSLNSLGIFCAKVLLCIL